MVTSTYNISIGNIQKLQKKHLQRQVKDKHFVNILHCISNYMKMVFYKTSTFLYVPFENISQIAFLSDHTSNIFSITYKR